MTTDPMPIQRVRIDTQAWASLGTAAPHGNRSAIIRDLIAWYLGRPGATLPDRPTPTTPDACGPACADGHMYENECTAPPMLMPVVGMHPDDNGPTLYSWTCYQDDDCERLVHLGYPTLPAARRAYDRHLKAEHGAVSVA